MPIKTRVPAGGLPWPLVLLEGPERVARWLAAEFTAGRTAYWLDMGLGAADEFAAVPGGGFLVVDHDGTWQDIVEQVEQLHALAAASAEPFVLVVDSMTAEWELLQEWTFRRSLVGNAWPTAEARHRQLMRLLLTFPGVVVMTARGEDTDAGYRVCGHRDLPVVASLWVRLARGERPQVMSHPVADEVIPFPFTLEWAIFEVYGLDQASAQPRHLTPLISDESDMAVVARAELGVFLRSRGLDWRPIAEQFYADHGVRLEDTTDPELVRALLRTLRDKHTRNPLGESTLADACGVLGVDLAAARARFVSEHSCTPADAEQAAVVEFCDRLHDEMVRVEAAEVSA
ncbi:MAG: hypothetical protein U5N53_28380 [Mycobacterium sp.]|nr:hypothetical protein [Mycobacterium sp.]